MHWEDINTEHNVIIIRHNFSLDYLTTPKDNEERLIPLTADLKAMLANHPRTLHSDFVFNTVKGKPYGINRLATIWRKACKELSIKGITLYEGSRHSFASQLVNEGESLDIIGEILGHADKRMTQKYAHVNLEAMRRAMEERDGLETVKKGVKKP